MTRHTRLAIIGVILAGCGGKAATKQPTSPAPVAAEPPAASTAAPATATANVNVDADLARKCELQMSSVEQAPKFDYNADELQPSDRAVLQQIADCLVKGPLQGRTVKLIGRADPRGTDEYNLALGDRRADHIRTYLQRLGVPASRMTDVTRGELDATGSDDAGWRRDRRVDLQLMN